MLMNAMKVSMRMIILVSCLRNALSSLENEMNSTQSTPSTESPIINKTLFTPEQTTIESPVQGWNILFRPKSSGAKPMKHHLILDITNTSSTNPEATDDSEGSHAFYETIVYNPDSKDASSTFTSDNNNKQVEEPAEYNQDKSAPPFSHVNVEGAGRPARLRIDNVYKPTYAPSHPRVHSQTPFNHVRHPEKLQKNTPLSTTPKYYLKEEPINEDIEEESEESSVEEDINEDNENIYDEVLSNIESLFSDDHVNGLRKNDRPWDSDFHLGQASEFEAYIMDAGEIHDDEETLEEGDKKEEQSEELSNDETKTVENHEIKDEPVESEHAGTQHSVNQVEATESPTLPPELVKLESSTETHVTDPPLQAPPHESNFETETRPQTFPIATPNEIEEKIVKNSSNPFYANHSYKQSWHSSNVPVATKIRYNTIIRKSKDV